MSTIGGWRLVRRNLAEHKRALAWVLFWSALGSLPALLSGLLIAAALNHGFLVGETRCRPRLPRCFGPAVRDSGVRHLPLVSRGAPTLSRGSVTASSLPSPRGRWRPVRTSVRAAAATCPAASNRSRSSATSWVHCPAASGNCFCPSWPP